MYSKSILLPFVDAPRSALRHLTIEEAPQWNSVTLRTDLEKRFKVEAKVANTGKFASGSEALVSGA
jgi:hypothetical protein